MRIYFFVKDGCPICPMAKKLFEKIEFLAWFQVVLIFKKRGVKFFIKEMRIFIKPDGNLLQQKFEK